LFAFAAAGELDFSASSERVVTPTVIVVITRASPTFLIVVFILQGTLV
jgi:hypothetical protein